MCSTCGGQTYGQEQSEARDRDVAKLKEVQEARAAKSASK